MPLLINNPLSYNYSTVLFKTSLTRRVYLASFHGFNPRNKYVTFITPLVIVIDGPLEHYTFVIAKIIVFHLIVVPYKKIHSNNFNFFMRQSTSSKKLLIKHTL